MNTNDYIRFLTTSTDAMVLMIGNSLLKAIRSQFNENLKAIRSQLKNLDQNFLKRLMVIIIMIFILPAYMALYGIIMVMNGQNKRIRQNFPR